MVSLCARMWHSPQHHMSAAVTHIDLVDCWGTYLDKTNNICIHDLPVCLFFFSLTTITDLSISLSELQHVFKFGLKKEEILYCHQQAS